VNAPAELDVLAHSPVRLGALAYLSAEGEADFTDIARALAISNGLLSNHLKKLEEAGYIALSRGFIGRQPNTRVRLTDKGLRAWTRHLEALDRLLRRPRPD
jgi:DNA-binding MarR family transcriptional regulator